MGHPSLENLTPFAFEAAFAADEEARMLLVPILKATYDMRSGAGVRIADKQIAINLAGEFWGEPGKSSYKYEPEGAFTKPATDVVLIGGACSGARPAHNIYVRFRAGKLDKIIQVTGDRYWMKGLGSVSISAPEPFETLPLIYERAFGGWDRSHPDPSQHTFDARNPVGTGFRSKIGRFEPGIRLPNLEDPRNPIRHYGDAPPPSAFGFTSPDWQPRAALAGSYDTAWAQNRMPLMPAGFDRRFFNAAASGLVATAYLAGDEPIYIENVSPHGPISFNLPGVYLPECRVELTARRDVCIEMNLDTVIVNTDENLLLLLWRGCLAVRNGPHDIVSIQIRANGVSVPAGVR